MKTRNGHTIELTRENLTINGIALPLITPGLPEFERSNRREELLLAIAAICAEEYGFQLFDGDGEARSLSEFFPESEKKEAMIFMFAVPHENRRDVYAVAVDAYGKFITGQICSDSAWALTDLASDRRDHPSNHAVKMDSRYPEGYVKVWREVPPANWDGQKTERPENI
jgi:hypothetical protein